ncbi:MAG TPA: alpha/beta fold hydrolase, partial [Vicinamibacterales bacterium]|nr:alpha/beta fold hydrolase [Vicinamibacterales bacterium]
LMAQDPIREIQGPAGRLEALLEAPVLSLGQPVRAAVVFAHPLPIEGGTMHTKAVYRATKALARIGCAVLRFNFRGVGSSEGTWDDGPGEIADFRAALDVMVARYPDTELWTAGFSFGSWVALTVGATDDRVRVLIGIAPPLDRYDFSVVAKSTKPKFFIQGEFDEICPLKRMYEFYSQAPEPKELVVIDGASHLFDGKVLEVGDAIEDLLGDYKTPSH